MFKRIKEWLKTIGFYFVVVVAVTYIFMALVTGIVAMCIGWYSFLFGGLK